MIWTMGEMIVEIMREHEDSPLDRADTFRGPFASGAPAIFIDTVARMNHGAGIISGVGVDDFGKCVKGRLTEDGVDTSLVLEDKMCSTGCAFVTYFADGSRKFIFHIGNTPAAAAKAPVNTPKGDIFHIMGCSLTASETFGNEIVKTAEAFKKNGAKITFDPNIRPEMLGSSENAYKILDMTSIFMPGVSELLLMSGCDTVEDGVKKCFENENLEIIALKNGSKGCRIFTREGEVVTFGIYPVTPVDATGAGDSFDGTFLVSYLEGKSLLDCAKRASAAAALNTAAFGPMEGKISVENVENMIKANPDVK